MSTHVVSEYRVLPTGMEPGDPRERYFALRVVDCGPFAGKEGGGWGVTYGGPWLSRSGTWDLPPRFRLWQFRWERAEDALAAAHAAVDTREIGRYGTYAGWLAEEEARTEKES